MNEEIEEKKVDKKQTFSWPTTGILKGETESLVIAARDQAILINYIIKIFKEKVDSRCRLCKQYYETIKHITTGCQVLAR